MSAFVMVVAKVATTSIQPCLVCAAMVKAEPWLALS